MAIEQQLMNGAPLVMVVDDARDNREAYAEYLQFRGFRTMEAATGEEALRQLGRVKPDVVLLDMRLPDLEGGEVTRRIRALEGAYTAIIAISACVFPQDVATAMGSGCDAFLSKPCLPEAVVTEIIRQLGRTRPCLPRSQSGVPA